MYFLKVYLLSTAIEVMNMIFEFFYKKTGLKYKKSFKKIKIFLNCIMLISMGKKGKNFLNCV